MQLSLCWNELMERYCWWITYIFEYFTLAIDYCKNKAKHNKGILQTEVSRIRYFEKLR